MATKKGGKDKGKSPKIEDDRDLAQMQECLDDAELENLYQWVDTIPLSRPKRNISRDFSDGVLVAEICHCFFPKLVEMHNYTAASNTTKKQLNWEVLNRKVFSKMNFELAHDVIDDLVMCKPGMIEKVLLMLQVKIKRAEYARQRQMNDKPEADQHRRKGVMKVGMEDTKGSKFVKAKQIAGMGRKLNRATDMKLVDEYGHIITQRYLDNKGWNSGYNLTVPESTTIKPQQQLQYDLKSSGKSPGKSNAVPKKRVGPVTESDMVPRYVLEEREQDVFARDETIQMLDDKIKKLEYLLDLKERRLASLNQRVDHHETHQLQQHQYRAK